MRFLGLLLVLCFTPAFSQEPVWPATPQPQPVKTWEQYKGKPATFFTFRSNWQAPPLRSNRQTFKSPTFLLSQAAMVGSMIVACRNRRSGEAWHSEAPAVAGVFGLDYLMARFFGEPFALGPAVYATVHYSQAAVK
jgi:hypothetical protein